MIVELIIGLVVVVFLYHKWAISYWQRRNVLSTGGDFFFGSTKQLLLFKKNPKDFFQELYQKYKDKKIVGFYNFYEPMLLVMDPEIYMKIFISDFNSFTDQPIDLNERNNELLRFNPFGTKGLDKWKSVRSIHSSMQTQSRLKDITPLVVKVGNQMIKYIREKKSEPILVGDLTKFYTIDVFSATACGLEPSAFFDNNNIFRKHAYPSIFSDKVEKAMLYTTFFPLVNTLLSVKFLNDEGDKMFRAMAKNMLEYRKGGDNQTIKNYIEHLIKLDEKRRAEGKEGFSDTEFAGHLLTAYLDAVETSATMLSYLILEMGNHPEIQERLREDIMEVGKEPEDFDFDKIHSITYLTMVLNEILRLHPLLLYFSRECTKNTKIAGVDIEKGTKVFIPYNSIVNDPQYFSEPEKFDPDRFSVENKITKGTFFPFGEGPRQCLGMKYAQLQIKCAVVFLLLKFKILPASEDTIGKNVENDEKISFIQSPKQDETLIFQPL